MTVLRISCECCLFWDGANYPKGSSTECLGCLILDGDDHFVMAPIPWVELWKDESNEY